MKREEKEKIWTAFWERQRSVTSSAVVSTEWNAISKAQFEAWRDFAEHLEYGARVLDLATGTGKLPMILRASRPDISMVGIDIADPLPPCSEGIELMGGCSMEDLPFDDNSFTAVVSQFGFEYGSTDTVAEEALRVLRPGGPVGLMVHRGDGQIMAHNAKRKDQLHWVIEEHHLFRRVHELLPEDNSLANEAVAFAQERARMGLKRFGQGAVAWELPEAVHRTLLLGPRGSREKLIATLKLIEDQARNELGRIQSLAEACAAADNREKLLTGFTKQDRAPIETQPVAIPGERPFADLIII